MQTIEHDPNRSAFISLVQGSEGKAFYILTPEGLNRGDQVESGDHVDIKTGNCLPLGNMPVGTVVHNVEQRPGAGGTLIRAAGSFGELIQKGEQRCRLRLSSGEHIMVLSSCKGTVGVVSNAAHQNEKIAKAGRSRWLGRRPSVRGVAMNPVDHPLGGGAAKSSGGRPSVSPWGAAKGTQDAFRRTFQPFHCATSQALISIIPHQLMPRSVWKGPFVDNSLLKKVVKARQLQKAGSKTKIKIQTWSRRSMILPEFVGLTFNVHNGQRFIPVTVNEEMVGHKLGEFSPTRKAPVHKMQKR